MDQTQNFSLTKDQVWLNAASEGPLPIAAAKALCEAIVWKSSPELLTFSKFHQVPLELKQSLAHLINADKNDIILGNSATYGIHLLANGLPFKSGDEIILMQNDFPTDILPWLSLQEKGIKVIQIKSNGPVLTPNELESHLNPKTRLVCIPHVHSFSGWIIDIKGIAEVCRRHKVWSIVNLSQSAGCIPIDIKSIGADAYVSAGYKWLLGPYGTGFCWIKPELRERLNYPQNYWISLMDESSLAHEGPLELNNLHTARRYDIFGTANFFNYVPWRASIDFLSSIGYDKIYAHNQELTSYFIDKIDTTLYHLISPKGSNIIVFTGINKEKNQSLLDHLKGKGYHLAYWKGNLRVSPHIYNTHTDLEGLVNEINSYGT